MKFVLISFLFIIFIYGNPISVFQTAKYTNDRLTPQDPISFSKEYQKIQGNVITVKTNITYQQILGFGGAFTEASGYVLSLLKPYLQEELIESLFGPLGNQYIMTRVHINSCDFSLASYSFDDVNGDISLDHFDISHDLVWLIPYIRKAQKISKHPFKIYASPWSPPAWMKTNGEMIHSDYPGLKPDSNIHQSWALYYVKFIDAYKSNGIDIWGLTVQNEPGWSPPWEGCYYNSSNERDFVRDFLGPTLKKFHPEVKVMIFDDQKGGILDFAKVVYSDSKASQYIWGTAFHWYDGDHFDNLLTMHQSYPGKNLLATEACDCPAVLGNWDSGEHYGHDIIGDLNNWALGWVHWNMFLNISGGPNHVNNNCDAPILADPKNQILYYQPSYFYMGHFSRFIPPNSQRIQLDSTANSLETVAFLTPINQIALIVMNTNNSTIPFTIVDQSHSVDYSIPGHSIQTLLYDRF